MKNVIFQLAFAILSTFTAAYLLYLHKMRKLTARIATFAVIVLGIALRICYMLYTGAGTRTYDVYRESWGHLAYIQHIADHFSLPLVNDCQAYHPPVHHILSAIALTAGRSVSRDLYVQLKFIQALMAILNSLTLVYFYKIMKEMKCSENAILAGVSMFAFHPTNIYFASRINNDNTLMFFYVLSFYFLIRWMNNRSFRNLLFLTAFSSLAALTKLSAIMLVPLIASGFLLAAVRDRQCIRSYIRQFAAFFALYLPLAASFQLRNYLLFGQSFGYVPSFGRGFTPSAFNLVYLPVGNMLADPFNKGGIVGGEYFLEFLIKSSLFGEWSYPGLEIPAAILILLAALIFIIVLTYIFTRKTGIIEKHGWLFLLNLAIPLALAAKFRTDLPVACSQDFRYISPILVTLSFFLGQAAAQAISSRYKYVKYTVIGSTAAFCMLSSVFVLLLANYE